MVIGLNRFKQHFAPYANQYVLIGGTACTVMNARSTVYLLEVKGKGIAVAESNNGLVKLTEFELD